MRTMLKTCIVCRVKVKNLHHKLSSGIRELPLRGCSSEKALRNEALRIGGRAAWRRRAVGTGQPPEMRSLLLFLLLTCCVLARPIQLLEGRLGLDVPSGFVELTQEEIALKFRSARPPQLAYANNRENMTVTIAITVSNTHVKPGELSQFGQTMVKVLGNAGTVEEHGVVDIGGRSWYRIVLASQAVDQPVRNEMLLTPMGAKVLMLNLNSTNEEYPKYKRALQKTHDSLKLQDTP